MWTFVFWLKLLATGLITNSHYSDVWPVSAMATGGLLGNVIFFAVSGFCLLGVKDGFLRFMGKRALRIYTSVILFSLFAALIGKYPLNDLGDVALIFTRYTFLLWMLILCVPFYFVANLSRKNPKIVQYALIFSGVGWMFTYIVFVDKSYYHIDTVESPFIMFLYFSAMLIGAIFKQNSHRIKPLNVKCVLATCVSVALYFASKLLFSKVESVSYLQAVNQITILVAMASVFWLAISAEELFKKLGGWINGSVKLVSSFTLQIYVVQFLIIQRFSSLVFPLNLAVVTLLIVLAGGGLYYVDLGIKKGVGMALDRIRKPREGK